MGAQRRCLVCGHHSMTEHRPKELSDALGGIGSIKVQESLVRAGSTLQLQFLGGEVVCARRRSCYRRLHSELLAAEAYQKQVTPRNLMVDSSSSPIHAGLGVGRRELRGLEGLDAGSALQQQRAVKQPELFLHSTSSDRDDYHSRHRGSSTGGNVRYMHRAEAARQLHEAATVAPLAPYDGKRLWRAFELGQPGAAIDYTAALRSDAVHRAAVTNSLEPARRSTRCAAHNARHATANRVLNIYFYYLLVIGHLT